MILIALVSIFTALQGPQHDLAGSDVRIQWADLDADGLEDALVLRPDGSVSLLRNLGDGSFAESGNTGLECIVAPMVLALGDWDRDGYLDLFVGPYAGPSLLLHNRPPLTFEAIPNAIDLEGPILHADWIDFDRDGLPDLHVGTPAVERLYHNLGDGSLRPVDLRIEGAAGVLSGPPVPDPAGEANVGGASGDGPSGTSAVGADSVAGSPAPRSVGGAPLDDSSRNEPGTRTAPNGPGRTLTGSFLGCAETIRDQSTGTCITVSSSPMLGQLYPLGPEFNIDSLGRVGIGTLSPSYRLHVESPSGTAIYARTTGALTSFDAATGGPAAVRGEAAASAARAAGVHGSAASTTGVGVTGSSTSPTGATAGVTGSSASTAGTGVVGSAPAPRGPTSGVTGQSASTRGTGVSGSSTAPRGPTSGVAGSSLSTAGAGVAGVAVAPIGPTSGVTGRSASTRGTGVSGSSTAPRGPTSGTSGASASTRGTGVKGNATAPRGPTRGVSGTSASTSGTGVGGFVPPPTAAPPQTRATGVFGSGAFGVWGEAGSTSIGGLGGVGVAGVAGVIGGIPALPPSTFLYARTGVAGLAVSTAGGFGQGVTGLSFSSAGTGVLGESVGTAGTGVLGRSGGTSGGGIAVLSDGPFVATGSKSFAQPHPTDPSKEIRFVSLEGNESGTYFRGTARLSQGRAVIPVPEEFRLVSEPMGLGVQVTPLGSASLWIEERSVDRIVVRGDPDVAFDYFVNGVRRGFADLKVVRNNVTFRPRFRGVPFGGSLRPAVRALLVGNGLLNPDFTPNEARILQLGWKLQEPGTLRLPARREDASGRAGKPRTRPEPVSDAAPAKGG